MTGKRQDLTAPGTSAATSGADEIAAFLARAKTVAPPLAGEAGRLIFALDATMSRQPTWDRACALQAGMFAEAARVGRLQVQLVYYRGIDECRAGKWVEDTAKLGGMMSRIDCRGGHTQIGRVLRHAVNEAAKGPVRALVFVGDAFEENIDDVCAIAGELALRGLRALMFHEGNDAAAGKAFAEIARLTCGAYCRFDNASAAELGALLRAAAVYAAGGWPALENAARHDGGARLLISHMR